MDITGFRRSFPITGERAYLFAGATAPACDPVYRRVQECLDRQRSDPLDLYAATPRLAAEARAGIAGLLGAAPDRVALYDGASRASASVIRLLGDGDPTRSVVVDRTTYPSSIYGWLVDGTHPLRVARPGPDPTAALLEQVDAATLAVAISHVCPLTGYRHDIETLGRELRGTGTALFVDVSQSLGAVPIDVVTTGVDVVVGTTMKWTLGLPGLGFAYVAAERDDGRLLDVGYAGLEDQEDRWPRTAVPPPLPGLQRLEVGMPGLFSVAAAAAGAAVIDQVTVAAVHTRIATLVRHVLTVCDDLGLQVMTPWDESHRAGVVALRHPAAARLAAQARSAGIDIGGYEWGLVRVDPHAYNSEDDIERLARFLRSTPA